MFRGMGERLKRELEGMAPEGVEVGVIARPDRRHAAWIGGSIVASLATFQKSWITRKDYEEGGAEVVHSNDIFTS